MSLCLQEPNPKIQLVRDLQVLVVHREDAHKGRVVGGDLCDVRVTAVAKLNMAVAAQLLLRLEALKLRRKLFNDVCQCND